MRLGEILDLGGGMGVGRAVRTRLGKVCSGDGKGVGRGGDGVGRRDLLGNGREGVEM